MKSISLCWEILILAHIGKGHPATGRDGPRGSG